MHCPCEKCAGLINELEKYKQAYQECDSHRQQIDEKHRERCKELAQARGDLAILTTSAAKIGKSLADTRNTLREETNKNGILRAELEKLRAAKLGMERDISKSETVTILKAQLAETIKEREYFNKRMVAAETSLVGEKRMGEAIEKMRKKLEIYQVFKSNEEPKGTGSWNYDPDENIVLTDAGEAIEHLREALETAEATAKKENEEVQRLHRELMGMRKDWNEKTFRIQDLEKESNKLRAENEQLSYWHQHGLKTIKMLETQVEGANSQPKATTTEEDIRCLKANVVALDEMLRITIQGFTKDSDRWDNQLSFNNWVIKSIARNADDIDRVVKNGAQLRDDVAQCDSRLNATQQGNIQRDKLLSADGDKIAALQDQINEFARVKSTVDNLALRFATLHDLNNLAQKYKDLSMHHDCLVGEVNRHFSKDGPQIIRDTI